MYKSKNISSIFPFDFLLRDAFFANGYNTHTHTHTFPCTVGYLGEQSISPLRPKCDRFALKHASNHMIPWNLIRLNGKVSSFHRNKYEWKNFFILTAD